jgi:hypothetical protein
MKMEVESSFETFKLSASLHDVASQNLRIFGFLVSFLAIHDHLPSKQLFDSTVEAVSLNNKSQSSSVYE